MTEQPDASSSWSSRLVDRFSDRDRWTKAVWLFFAAIGLTVIGDIGFEVVTFDICKYSPLNILWRIVLVAIAVLAVAAGIDDLVDLFRRPEPEVAASSLIPVESKPALIVMASAPREPKKKVGPHFTAFRYYSKVKDSKLEHVYVIHSKHDNSVESANLLVQEVHSVKNRNIKAYMDGLSTDFENPEAVLATIKAAIGLASTEVGGPKNVLLESTGGTAMASVGAALAKLDNPKITLTYIPQTPDGGFGDTPKEVPISMELTGRYHAD